MKVFLSYKIHKDQVFDPDKPFEIPESESTWFAKRIINALKDTEIEVIELDMPEIYTHKIALKNLQNRFDLEGTPIHLIVKPFKEIRFLKSAKNIIVTGWEHYGISSEFIDWDPFANHKYIFGLADEIWAISEFSKNQLINAGISASKIKLIPLLPNLEKNGNSSKALTQMNPVFINHLGNFAKFKENMDRRLYFLNERDLGYKTLKRFLTVENKIESYTKTRKNSIGKVLKNVNKGVRQWNKLLKFALKTGDAKTRFSLGKFVSEKAEFIRGIDNSFKFSLSLKNENTKILRIDVWYPLQINYSFINTDNNETYFYQKVLDLKEALLPGEETKIDLEVPLHFKELPDGEYTVEISVSLDDVRYTDIKGEAVPKVKLSSSEKLYKDAFKIYSEVNLEKNPTELLKLIDLGNSFNQDDVITFINVKLSGSTKAEKFMYKMLKKYYKENKLGNTKPKIAILHHEISESEFPSFIKNFDIFISQEAHQDFPVKEIDSVINNIPVIFKSNSNLAEYIKLGKVESGPVADYKMKTSEDTFSKLERFNIGGTVEILQKYYGFSSEEQSNFVSEQRSSVENSISTQKFITNFKKNLGA